MGLKKGDRIARWHCQIEDFAQCDAIFYLGQNRGTNSPRILHPLQEAVKRGCRIVTFNPLKEAGLRQSAESAGNADRQGHADEPPYLQVRPGGAIAALMGACKRVLARAEYEPDLLDKGFLAEHANGCDTFRDTVAATDWDALEQASGVSRAEMEAAGDV